MATENSSFAITGIKYTLKYIKKENSFCNNISQNTVFPVDLIKYMKY